MINKKQIRIFLLIGLTGISQLTLGMNPDDILNDTLDDLMRDSQSQQPKPQQNTGNNQAQAQAEDTPAFIKYVSLLFNGIGNGLGRIGEKTVNAIDKMAENRRNAAAAERMRLENTLEKFKDDKNNPIYIQAFNDLERWGKEQEEAEKAFNQMRQDALSKTSKLADAVINGASKYAEEDAERRKLEGVERAKGETRVKQTAVAMQVFFKNMTFEKVAGGSLAVFGAYYGLKFGYQVLEDWYKVPELADKTTLLSVHKRIYNKIMGIQPFTKTRDDIILNDELKKFMNEYIDGTKNIIKHGGYLRHILLPGPPGTGKTLMSEVIAHELGLPSIYFAASKLLNCDTETALVRLTQLFTYAQNSATPIVIIMDESEIIFGDRSKATSEKVSAIKNQIMANTGTEQSNFILIALTNRLQDFDKAFKSRFNNIVEVTPPAHAQRKQILELYVNNYIKNPKFKVKKTFIGSLFAKKESKKVTYDEVLFTAQGIETLAKQLDGFTGRNISHLVLEIREKALASDTAHITQATINNALTAMKAKVAEEQKEYATDGAGAARAASK